MKAKPIRSDPGKDNREAPLLTVPALAHHAVSIILFVLGVWVWLRFLGISASVVGGNSANGGGNFAEVSLLVGSAVLGAVLGGSWKRLTGEFPFGVLAPWSFVVFVLIRLCVR